MSFPADDSADQQVPWLPAERFEIALDAEIGASSAPPPTAGRDLLVVTNHRAIKTGESGGARTTSLLPLTGMTGIEVVDISRSPDRLTQGLLALAVGIVLGWVSWIVAGVPLISLIIGGLPLLAAVYLLSGYAFPDAEGELVLHSGGQSVRLPLRTKDSRRDAYLVAHRLYELLTAASTTVHSGPSLEEQATTLSVAPPAEPSAVSQLTAMELLAMAEANATDVSQVRA